MPTPRNILIACLGSHGDVHPFVGIGRALIARGHRVTLICPPLYETMILQSGLDFAAIGTIERFQKIARDPNLWHPKKGFTAVAAGVAESLPDYYRAVIDHHQPGDTIILNSSLAFGGKAAQEKLGIPGFTVHLSPSVLRSLIDPPKTPPLPIAAWQPDWLKRLIYSAVDRLVIDRALGGPLNAFRKSVGLPAIKGLFKFDPDSRENILCLFPQWFAPKPADWPVNTVLTDFPLFDEADLSPISDDLLRFLDAGDPPIAFTPGSAMFSGHNFFAQAAGTCAALNRRGLFLSRHPDHLPTPLPANIHHESYAPFSKLLPRCAALVHHGGIGTMSQALAAGVPQLLTTFGFDQTDNAIRAQKLGVARWIPALKFTAAAASKKLRELLDSKETAQSLAAVKKRFEGVDALKETIDAIERLPCTNKGEDR